ncbi:protein translocase subunit SecD [Actinotalea sp. BY-33]|uniref:Protein translocase subunit SecD n=1 Tax=Actinotalea soli TaxID=2819234 RepID=A0A939LN87_9CELL|nr:protein translocase subunit SecD [Actinotalea soli]
MVSALFGGLLAGTHWSDASMTPDLALDLEGGTQIILTPVSENDERVTEETIEQSIEIIRQRVDASGVAEAEISSQGGTNIVVGLPGEPTQDTLDLVRESAQMLFRPVIVVTAPTPDEVAEDAESASDEEAAATDESADAGATDEEGASQDEAVQDEAVQDEATQDEATESSPEGDAEGSAVEPTDPSDFAWVTDAVLEELGALDCTDPANLTGGAELVGEPDEPVVACGADGSAKYVLGPVEVEGQDVASASSGLRVNAQGIQTTEWATTIDFDGEGTRKFRDVTTRLLSLESPRNQFAMVLDGLVISAPQVNSIIIDGNAEITGSFTRESAGTLARQLNFGALPLTFVVQSEQQISATLGAEQLQRGLLAGLIGLILVGVYSLVQYRALGLVTISSLVIAGLFAYGLITFLSWAQGYRLSLPGVAGLIVAIGITADSFIVYFERIRDELRDGRSLRAAVDEAWRRARRTILISDAVSLLAAVVLYFLAVGGVRGFAFTLGLTTVIDLLVVFMFTHPVMKLIARTRFFAEGHRLSGLDASALRSGVRYAGRGRVTDPSQRGGRGTSPAAAPGLREGERSEQTPVTVPVSSGGPRMTIAERRAAERRAAQPSVEPEGDADRRDDGKDA